APILDPAARADPPDPAGAREPDGSVRARDVADGIAGQPLKTAVATESGDPVDLIGHPQRAVVGQGERLWGDGAETHDRRRSDRRLRPRVAVAEDDEYRGGHRQDRRD